MADNTYRPGETVEITGIITDLLLDRATPSVSIICRIADESDVVKAEAKDMTIEDVLEATGAYYYAHDLPVAAEVGTWKYEVIATDGAGNDVTIDQGTFTVAARAITPV